MSSRTRNHLKRIIRRRSPFAEPGQDESDEIIDYLLNQCKVLVIGAGGLGCELLKDLALIGIRNMEVIDMDTIELTNLNRQFLFRKKDIGKSKAQVAAEFVQRLVPDCTVVAHFKKIQDFSPSYYHKFNIVICGLDSIEARRWISCVMVNLVEHNKDGTIDQSSVIPLIDGGTEGLKGNARVILPGMTACIECNLDLYPPPVNYPLCTIANTPRLPEHTIEYARSLLWVRENPFGVDVDLNPDDIKHVQWIHEKSIERAREFKIEEPTLKFTQGVIKRTIPAVSSTNACIAATCVMEAFKLITSTAFPMNNYQMLNLTSGIYSYVFEAEKDENCLVCGPKNKPPEQQNQSSQPADSGTGRKELAAEGELT